MSYDRKHLTHTASFSGAQTRWDYIKHESSSSYDIHPPPHVTSILLFKD